MSFPIFLITCAIVVLGLILVYRLYRHYSIMNLGTMKFGNQSNKLLKAEANKIKKRNNTAKMLANLRNFTTAIPFLKESEQKMQNLNYYAKRLNIVLNDNTLSGEDLFAIRGIIIFIYVIIVCITIVFSSLYLIPLLLLYKFPALILDRMFEITVKDKNTLLLKDFRDFYAEFFYNYRHKANRGVKITEVAMRFYNRANPETKLLIDNLRADATQSEEYALDQMKDLFRVTKVHRMADQVKMIIIGKTQNTDAMEGFKREIEDEFRAEKKKKLAIKKMKANGVQLVAWIILTEIVMAFSITAMLPK